jgi:hypothetical protein
MGKYPLHLVSQASAAASCSLLESGFSQTLSGPDVPRGAEG